MVSIILSKACQPPVIGSVLGMVVTAMPPIRGIMALEGATLQWFLDGLGKVGRSTIPVSMALLGMHMSHSIRAGSASDSADTSPFEVFHWTTMVGTICGKLIVMPMIGFSSFLVLRHVFAIQIPQSMAVVLLLVWTPPTASNAVVMSDLAGGMREAVAQILLYEYMVVPILLSVSISFVILISGLDVS